MVFVAAIVNPSFIFLETATRLERCGKVFLAPPCPVSLCKMFGMIGYMTTLIKTTCCLVSLGVLSLELFWTRFGGEGMNLCLIMFFGKIVMLHKSKCLCVAVISGIEADGKINGHAQNSTIANQIRWLQPEPGEVAFNCDGSVIDAGLRLEEEC